VVFFPGSLLSGVGIFSGLLSGGLLSGIPLYVCVCDVVCRADMHPTAHRKTRSRSYDFVMKQTVAATFFTLLLVTSLSTSDAQLEGNFAVLMYYNLGR